MLENITWVEVFVLFILLAIFFFFKFFLRKNQNEQELWCLRKALEDAYVPEHKQEIAAIRDKIFVLELLNENGKVWRITRKKVEELYERIGKLNPKDEKV